MVRLEMENQNMNEQLYNQYFWKQKKKKHEE